MILELLFILLIIILFSDYFYKNSRNKVFEKNGFKGLPSLPIVGSVFQFFNVTAESIFKFFTAKCHEYGKTWYMWEFHEATIFTTDIPLIKAILSNSQTITKNSDYELANDWIGGGLLLSTGKKWQQRRKIITPTFHLKILEEFIEVFNYQSIKLVEKLNEFSDGETIVDVYPKICLTALDTIIETAMGVTINAQDDPEIPYVKAVSLASEMILKRSLTPGWRYDIVMRLVAPKEFKAFKDSIKTMHDFSNNIIQKRREVLEKSRAINTSNSNDFSQVGTKKRMALLDLLLQTNIDEEPLTNEDIRQEVDTFMFAGHDTTTAATSHILYLISRHPTVQQKLYKEIYAVFEADKQRKATMHDLNKLKYLECVIKEGLRLHPPVPFIGRYIKEDIILDEKFIPAKTDITILIYQVLKDPTYFPEPEIFKPERFEEKHNIDLFAYIPFSAGPRKCIGQNFAMFEMKTLISKILLYYELTPLGEKVRPSMGIVLRSVTGCQLGLKLRG